MHERKRQLIEVGMKLFAQKGYHATSIQEIASQSDVSKGAFYLHFDSKEDLTLAIYKFYYQQLMEKVEEVRQTDLPPKEKMTRQLEVFITSLMENKEFIIMHLRDNVSLSPQVDDFLLEMKTESFRWTSENLKELFGEAVEPYIVDSSILMEGILDGYAKWLVIDELDVEPQRLASFIQERIVDAVEGILKKEEEPLITLDNVKRHFPSFHQQDPHSRVKEQLTAMRGKIDSLKMAKQKRDDLHGVVDVLLNEIKKEQPQPILFQGMLSHFKGIPAFEKECRQIARNLNIELI
ncbi:TetR family transcriptional regulator [Thalassobacillus devorans]|uniref:TetR family transcriptional regulator n=1 Tax=Thalassobacillus devorans TaxID=279813 RepID=A0ABQ1NV19_9BACI|nr:TetR/AcrR family transcriptional regulator [Thalassobacillus devorans]NIK28501.1 AcrR family transcriptional regulator [Thalassobacillus devorans]GGC85734.1 TetR family transcriptional regulator [Thalassobacillus devorans]